MPQANFADAPAQVELLRLEFHRYFNVTINKQRCRVRSFVVQGNPLANSSIIELRLDRASVPVIENWLNSLAKLDANGVAAARSRIELPLAGEVYTITGVLPVSIDVENCFAILRSTSYH